MSLAKNQEIVEEVHKLVVRGHQVTLKLTENKLHINHYATDHIFQQDLGKRKICAKLVSQSHK
jgi:hypothetical protein